MPNNRRFSEIMLGLFLLFLGVSAMFEGGSVFMTVLVLAGIFMLVRQFDNGRQGVGSAAQTRRAERYWAETADTHDDQHRRIYQHALEAVEAAGHDPETVRVLVTDVGVMAFQGDQDPMVYRTRDVLDDVDYVQPYVQLRLPTKAIGRIRFEIVDAAGETVFIHEEHHQLERGRNLITPAARLPVHDAQMMDGSWQLRISADDMLLAVHDFGWEETAAKVVRRHLTDDGEISNELRAALAESRLQKVSLDDLLAEQEEEEQSQARQQR